MNSQTSKTARKRPTPKPELPAPKAKRTRKGATETPAAGNRAGRSRLNPARARTNHSVSVDPVAWKALQAEAKKLQVSASELVNRFALTFVVEA